MSVSAALHEAEIVNSLIRTERSSIQGKIESLKKLLKEKWDNETPRQDPRTSDVSSPDTSEKTFEFSQEKLSEGKDSDVISGAGKDDGPAQLIHDHGENLFNTQKDKSHRKAKDSIRYDSEYFKKALQQQQHRLKARSEREPEKENFKKEGPEVKVRQDKDALFGAVVRSSWIQTLRSYSSSQQLLNALEAFQRSLTGTKNSTLAAQYLERAARIILDIEVSGVHWKDPQDLRSLILKTGGKDLMPVVKSLEMILKEINEVTTLTAQESEVWKTCQEYIAKINMKNLSLEDIHYGKAFLKTQKGPLSLQHIKSRYAIQGDIGNWAQLKEDLLGGKLNTFLMIPHLRPYLKMLLHKTTKLAYTEKNLGLRRPIDDEEYKLEPADEITSWRNFYRNGPPNKDVDRLLSGDLLEMTYREPVQRPSPHFRKDKKIIVILFDISESMWSDRRRYLVKHALILGCLDLAQMEVAQGLSEYTVVAIPWNSTIGEATVMKNLKENYDYFSKLADNPIVSLGGTAMTSAILAGYDYVIERAHIDPALKKANILFLTDGNDPNLNFNAIINRRKNIRSDIDLSFTTVTIVEGNPALELAEKNGQGLEAFGSYSYRFLDSQTVDRISDAAANLDILLRKAFNHIDIPLTLSKYDLTRMAQSASRLEPQPYNGQEYKNLKDKLQARVDSNDARGASSPADWRMLENYHPSPSLPKSMQQMYRVQLLKSFLHAFQAQNSGKDLSEILDSIPALILLNWLTASD